MINKDMKLRRLSTISWKTNTENLGISGSKSSLLLVNDSLVDPIDKVVEKF